MMGKIESEKRRGWQEMRWLDSTTSSMNMDFFPCFEMYFYFPAIFTYQEQITGKVV